MTTTAHRSARASSAPALDRAADAIQARREADVALLVAAVEWAEAHPAGPGLDPAGRGDADLLGERFLPLAGEGAPLVAEFAPIERGAVLGWTNAGAQLLMGEGLEIKHRPPRLWSLVLELRIPVHLAREVAQHTRHLALRRRTVGRPAPVR